MSELLVAAFPTAEELLKKFNYRCARCGKSPATIHEITPRSLLPRTWGDPKNRIALCAGCHEWAHKMGTKITRKSLYQIRERFDF